MMYKKVLSLCLLLVLLLTGSGTVLASPPEPQVGTAVAQQGPLVKRCYSGCGGVSGAGSSNEAYEQEVVELVNEVRAEQSPPLPPFKRVSPLDEASRYHTRDMVMDNYFPGSSLISHATYDRNAGDQLIFVCEWDERLSTYYANSLSMSENSAAGYSSPEAVMAGWMSSTGHRNNILSSYNWEIGVGYNTGSGTDYFHYWNQNFGRRNGAYPIVINREAAETDSALVDLYIYGSDTWSEMRLRNNDGTWTDWQDFQTQLSWMLPQVIGTHTVEVEMRDGGQTTSSSDSIYLTQGYVAPTLNDVPDQITFTYDATIGQLTPISSVVTLSNTTSSATIEWSLATEDDWFSVTPESGDTPGMFTIAPTTFFTRQTATYTGIVTVTAEVPTDTVNAVQSIDLVLNVIAPPTLRDLPDALDFTYRAVQGDLTPPTATLQLDNILTEDVIAWEIVTEGDWFEVSSLSGQTPATLLITPTTFVTDQLQSYAGAITVTATSPEDTANAEQRVDLSLDVQVPKLGGLPDNVAFTYVMDSGNLRPESITLTPTNVGSDDDLQWSVTTNARWMHIEPLSGTTPQSFTVTPIDFNTLTIFLYTGVLTVTVDGPALAAGQSHVMPLTLEVVETDTFSIYLPVVMRNF